MWDTLLIDCHAATMAKTGERFGAIRDAAIGIDRGRLAFVGASASVKTGAREIHSLKGAWVTPGLIDCHTHAVFAGNRAQEWAMRLQGASYEEIAKAGGGILSTVKATRAASLEALVASTASRLLKMAEHGVTTVEIKSGYGLDLENETKMLVAAERAGKIANIHVSRSFLGAHALPPEFAHDRKAYLDRLCAEDIPKIAQQRLADSVDAFCETIAFTKDECRRVFEAARSHGLPVRLHAEQRSDQGGAQLAAEHGALSADHLEHLSEEGIAALARAGTVAVLLPAAYYFLRDTNPPPIAALRKAGVPIAIASDCNPGTSPMLSLTDVLNMGCTLFRLTPEEALQGVTRHAAKALGLEKEVGTLEAGKVADLAVWDIGDPAELAYWIGAHLMIERYVSGQLVRNAWRAE
jgi:imidazolonepropionase